MFLFSESATTVVPQDVKTIAAKVLVIIIFLIFKINYSIK